MNSCPLRSSIKLMDDNAKNIAIPKSLSEYRISILGPGYFPIIRPTCGIVREVIIPNAKWYRSIVTVKMRSEASNQYNTSLP